MLCLSRGGCCIFEGTGNTTLFLGGSFTKCLNLLKGIHPFFKVQEIQHWLKERETFLRNIILPQRKTALSRRNGTFVKEFKTALLTRSSSGQCCPFSTSKNTHVQEKVVCVKSIPKNNVSSLFPCSTRENRTKKMFQKNSAHSHQAPRFPWTCFPPIESSTKSGRSRSRLHTP